MKNGFTELQEKMVRLETSGAAEAGSGVAVAGSGVAVASSGVVQY